ncbi:MAG: methyl-accepting chemotaxis protein [Lachnospiraceae bacterium]|nr:methyl-accepting chemotaxis protein [Lachnospiraceae bacterium]
MANNRSKKKTKIKNKLLIFLVPAVVITILALVMISTYLSRKSLQEMAVSQLSSSISNQTDNIESWLDRNLQDFSAVKNMIEKTGAEGEELAAIINSCYGFNRYCKDGPYIATADGQVYKAEESTKEISDPAGQPWFKQGMTRVNMAYGNAYKNSDGQSVISASGIINDGSDTLKIMAADLSLDQISIIVNSGVKMDQAASFLVDTSDNTILAHRDPARVSSTLSVSDPDPMMAAIAGKVLARDYTADTLDRYVVDFSTIDETEWVLVSYVSEDVVMKSVYRLTYALVIAGVIATIIIVVLINLMVSRVVAPLGGITKNISDMSSGDFTIKVDQKSNDEIGVMGGKVSEFVESMRKMLSSINAESERLKEQSDNSDRVSKSMYEASQSQSEAMQNLNNTVDQLAIAVNEIAENATTLALVVSDTRDNSQQANASMKETVEISKRGRSDMEKLARAMQDIKSTNDELVESVNEVGRVSDEITHIVGLISEIADETNLLSLNASIEAARAGEAGKGFAVVATEIAKLAQNSADSADSIRDLIDKVRKAISHVVDQAKTSAGNIEQNSVLIAAAVDMFDEIYENIEKSNEKIGLMIKDVEKVDDVAGNVAAISEEQAASTQEILQTSKHMVEQANNITRNSQDVADNSHELANTSDTLTSYVQQFKI